MTGRGDDTRDRLLRAAAELLDQAGGEEVSTRAVCERAGVRAPTLYHHFGSKDGLIEAVVDFGVHQYTQQQHGDDAADPVAQLRRGWDDHVQYGLQNPSFYVLLYGRIKPGKPCAVTSVAQRRLIALLERLGDSVALSTSCEQAAGQLVAANVGVTLYLIGLPEDERDLQTSTLLRESVLAGLLREPRPTPSSADGDQQIAAAAGALLYEVRSSLGDRLTPGETGLLIELLARLSSPE
jgi:AcrR family transcriptional regulator